MNNPTPEAVAAALALVDAHAETDPAPFIRAHRHLRPFCNPDETPVMTSARILAAAYRQLKGETQ